VADRFIGGGNRNTRGKITDLSQVTDKLYHIMLHTSLIIELLITWKGSEREAVAPYLFLSSRFVEAKKMICLLVLASRIANEGESSFPFLVLQFDARTCES
jgi:hypothetical protein